MNNSLSVSIGESLKKAGLKLKTAESFTGGGLASRIVSVPGASEYFIEGIVCYSPLSKINRLNVPKELIETKGVVSSEVARAMAEGLLLSGDCDIAVATTGNAGPDADEKGVGTCYLAVGTKDGITVSEKHYKGERRTIIDTAIDDCIEMIYNIILRME